MGVEPPYLYDSPSRFPIPDSFNPRAVSQASYASQPQRPPPDGPLVNFNRHPDSYLILPYGNTNAKPMNPKTKDKVQFSRWLQLALRCAELLAAIGLLICAICVRNVDGTVAWLLRAPPGVGIFHTIYAIYHLGRKPSGRTPGSSASYMLFAAAIDVSLLPFFIFAALVSGAENQQRALKSNTIEWTSVFSPELNVDDSSTTKIVYSLFLLASVNTAFHLTSLLISLYLAVVFRKIARLPPDMNPLESNLTSRHKKKHSSVSEKRMSQATLGSTFSGPTDSERTLRNGDGLPQRTVPFMHTRKDSAMDDDRGISVRGSRADLPSQISNSARSSRTDLNRSGGHRSAAKRGSQFTESRSIHDNDVSPSKRGIKSQILTDNWYVHVPIDDEDAIPQRNPSEVSSLHPSDHIHAQRAGDYEPLPQPYENDSELMPHPLGMNPPTPQPDERSLTSTTGNRAPTPKSKFYGNLKPGTPPLMVGTAVDLPRESGTRVISSGSDWMGRTTVRGRDVSGKVVEEGRGNGWGWRRN